MLLLNSFGNRFRKLILGVRADVIFIFLLVYDFDFVGLNLGVMERVVSVGWI